MSLETNANDHVPLEFLLGARAHHYAKTIHRNDRDCCSKSKDRLAPSLHVRKREDQARQLLQNVVNKEASCLYQCDDWSCNAGAKVCCNDGVAQRCGHKDMLNKSSSQSSLQPGNSTFTRTKIVPQHDIHESWQQTQRVASFHGYMPQTLPFLNITGNAARCVSKTKCKVKSCDKSKDETTQQLRAFLRHQQQFTRVALKESEQIGKSLSDRNYVSKNLLSLESMDIDNSGSSVTKWKGGHRTDRLLQRFESTHPEPSSAPPSQSILATQSFESRALPSQKYLNDTMRLDFPKDKKSHVDIHDEREQKQQVLRDRQREMFKRSVANGVFLGGGFLSKNPHPSREKSSTQGTNEQDEIEQILHAHSTFLRPLDK